MRTGIIGGGLAGLLAAWLLREHREVVLFEARPRLGGALHTQELAGLPVELGFRWFAPQTHPRLSALVSSLGLATHEVPADVSLTQWWNSETMTLPPAGARHLGLLARRPQRVAQLLHFRRVFDEAEQAVLGPNDWSLSLDDFARRQRLDPHFVKQLLLPWLDAPLGGQGYARLRALGAYTPLAHLASHRPQGMSRPIWRALSGGAGALVDALSARLAGAVDLRCGAEVVAVENVDSTRHRLRLADRPTEELDELVVATPAALPLFGRSAAPTAPLDVVVHRDRRWVPSRASDRALFNIMDFGERAVATLRLEGGLWQTWISPAAEEALGTQHRLGFAGELHRARFQVPVAPPGWRPPGVRDAALPPAVVLAAGDLHGIDVAESAVLGAERAARALVPELPRSMITAA